MNKYDTPVLNEREKTHGAYQVNAALSQHLKACIREVAGTKLTSDQQESLDLICTKIGRICSGSPNVIDHWEDIAGYAKLIAERLARPAEHPTLTVV